MLTQAVGGLLASAIAVALSPIPIIAVVVMLGTPRARSNGPAFAVGWIAGLLVVSVVVLLVAGGSSNPDSGASTTTNVVQIVIGVVFLVMAARQWKKRPKKGEAPAMPAWMATVDTITPVRSMVLGLALSGANPKNLALTLNAAASIAQEGLDRTDTAIAVAVFVAVASLTVVGAVLYYLVDAKRAAGPLDTVKQFMAAHNAAIMMVILLVIGAKILGDGIAGFRG